ncbi:MAG: tetratricopeptide repeat protein [Sphingobacteriales bacterium]|nr:MAG: tetratricopeptide repeat protein [Sphingobacteriales bacterium]
MKSLRIRTLVVFLFALTLVACKDEQKTEQKDSAAFRNAAILDLTERIEKNPQNHKLYYERGQLFNRMHEDSLALEDFKKAATLDSSKAEYFSAIGDLMFEHKDISGSIRYIQKALSLNPDDPAAHLKMAKMFVYLKDYPKAFSEINVVLRQDVYNAEGYFLKGMIYKDLKDTTKALSSFLTATEVDPEYREAILQLALLHGYKNDPIAFQYYDKAFKMDTTDVFPIYAKGVYMQDRKQYEKAKEFYKEAILRDQQYANAYFNMGYILMQQDSFEKARRQYDLLTKIEIGDFEAYYNRGLCSEMMGKKEDAMADYRQALVFNPDYETAKEGLKRLGVQ